MSFLWPVTGWCIWLYFFDRRESFKLLAFRDCFELLAFQLGRKNIVVNLLDAAVTRFDSEAGRGVSLLFLDIRVHRCLTSLLFDYEFRCKQPILLVADNVLGLLAGD